MPSARTARRLHSPERVERRQQQAIEIDPDFAGAYKGLACVHIHAAGVHATRTHLRIEQRSPRLDWPYSEM
jgi:hypothetical protein